MDIKDRDKLPAGAIAQKLNTLLHSHQRVVVTAPPGAGKSTLLPLTILEDTPEGKILMLEPRRLAARQIASRMSAMLSEPCGKTAGYRVRFESKVSAGTKIEVLTEGILTRRMVSDPTLDGVAAVIFDEFHERSINSDVALALVRECQELIRPDLKIIIMSATIDAEGICKALDAPLVEAEGRMFPVDIRHWKEEALPGNAAELTAHVIRLALRETAGDILAFLPGEAEIRRCAELLQGLDRVFPLYGMLSKEEQDRAIAPSKEGERKIVIATPIAETSLTIEGVRAVVDSGLCRKQVYEPSTGLGRLETVRISKDMADQRAGRAGRVAPGVCYRLWSSATEARMAACRAPEILEADLAGTTLDIAAFGSRMNAMSWLTPPPEFSVKQAEELLRLLGALDDDGQITRVGKSMAALPCHPRIARMLLGASDDRLRLQACEIAAILEEKDPISQEDTSCDLNYRIKLLREAGGRGRWSRIARNAEQYQRLAGGLQDVASRGADGGAEGAGSPDPYETGELLALAYPERIAKAREEAGAFLLATGDLAYVDKADPLASSPWIVAASLNARLGGGGRIYLAAPIEEQDIKPLCISRDVVSWDSRAGAIYARREERIGKLVVSSRQLSEGIREKAMAAICEAAVKEGTSMFDFAADDVQGLQRRVAAVAQWHPELELPDLGTEAVLARTGEWLPLYAQGATSSAELRKIDLYGAIWGLLSYEQQQAVERYAPSHLSVPTGSRIRLEYRTGAEAPVLRVRLQECFGLVETPRVDGGRIPVLMELLSPGYKPVQLTSDLRSFWQGTYFEVRKELRRRYPKHSWPDDPLEAEAVRGVKRK